MPPANTRVPLTIILGSGVDMEKLLNVTANAEDTEVFREELSSLGDMYVWFSARHSGSAWLGMSTS